LSLGVASIVPQTNISAEILIAEADQTLYQAKKNWS
jgi:PleD family two-component response regulator